VQRIPRLVFRRAREARRIVSYLEEVRPDAVPRLRHVYFGHTHAPFTGYRWF
jgi:hypothetical protein